MKKVSISSKVEEVIQSHFSKDQFDADSILAVMIVQQVDLTRRQIQDYLYRSKLLGKDAKTDKYFLRGDSSIISKDQGLKQFSADKMRRAIDLHRKKQQAELSKKALEEVRDILLKIQSEAMMGKELMEIPGVNDLITQHLKDLGYQVSQENQVTMVRW